MSDGQDSGRRNHAAVAVDHVGGDWTAGDQEPERHAEIEQVRVPRRYEHRHERHEAARKNHQAPLFPPGLDDVRVAVHPLRRGGPCQQQNHDHSRLDRVHVQGGLDRHTGGKNGDAPIH